MLSIDGGAFAIDPGNISLLAGPTRFNDDAELAVALHSAAGHLFGGD